MAKLIIKNGYIKGGIKNASHLSHLVNYIATRDGVEKIKFNNINARQTDAQKNLIKNLISDYPESKNSYEYDDYILNPSASNATEFITETLEQFVYGASSREKYLDYIANRPRVEIIDKHGLFNGSNNKIILSKVVDEISTHTGNVWTPIISLRREDADSTDYQTASAWKSLISSKVFEIANSLKIHPDNFRWYAAFHNEGHHPHIHLICYSTNPNEGYLNKAGIEKMKSTLANEIFKQQLAPLYIQKTMQRDGLKKEVEKIFKELQSKILTSDYTNPLLEEYISNLYEKLGAVTGKKQYGYLRPPLKSLVDKIIDEISKEEIIKEAYSLWCETQDIINNFYQDTKIKPIPLSQQKEFKSIKNMIIQEVLKIDMEYMETPEYTFTESVTVDDIYDEVLVQEEIDSSPQGKYHVAWSENYKQAKTFLYGDDETKQNIPLAIEYLKREADTGNALATFDLAKMYENGVGVKVDTEKSYELYSTALLAFEQIEKKKSWKYTQYRIGKMYMSGLGTEQNYELAAKWLSKSAEQEYKYAEYSLGGLYYRGQGVEQNYDTAFRLYLKSAKGGFAYSAYEVAKMYRDGVGTDGDAKKSDVFFRKAFIGFTSMEAQSHDDKLQYRLGNMLQKGIGTEIDLARAKKYYEMSASVKNPFACYSLAKLILEDTSSTELEINKAIEYLKIAVENKNQYAEYSLGKIYLEGKFIEKDIAKALELLHHSAEQGNQYAEYTLGNIYLKGEEVSKDITKALEYLNKSMAQSNESAKYLLGVLYLKGEDVVKDIPKAIEYLTEIAENGNEYAQFQLGKLYLLGKDIEVDKDKAVKWFTLSAEQGNEYAQFFLDNMDRWQKQAISMCMIRLLNSISKIFEDKLLQDSTTSHQQVDRKQRRKTMEKKLALGQKIGDQEQENMEQRFTM